jgi:hypothetical protein
MRANAVSLLDSLVAASSGQQPPSPGGDPWFVLRETLAGA